MGGRRRRTVVAVALLAATSCMGDEFRDANGELTATPEPLHFGVVAIGSEARKSIELRNVGLGPLSILDIERGEGLEEAFSTPEGMQADLRGGGKRSLEVRFRPDEKRRYEGRFVLVTSSPTHPRLEVSVSGSGEHPSVACSSRLAFGEVVLNTEKTLRVTCVNGGRVAATVRIDAIGGDDPQLFRLGTDEASLVVEAGESAEIPVTFSATRLGTARAVLPLHFEGAENPDFEVELSGEGYASHLVAAPNCLHFGAVGPGASARRSVIVANGGETRVTFEGPSILDGSGVFSIDSTVVEGRAEALVALDPGEQAEIAVRFSPGSIGRYFGALRLRNDDPIGSHLEVCLTGLGGGADILASPSPLDFGTVAVGMRVTRQVLVTNVGTLDGGPLRIQGASTSGDGFSVTFLQEVEIAPGDAGLVLEVAFHPTEERSHLGTLLIFSNDGDAPALPVPLLANAKAVEPCRWEATPAPIRFVPVQRGHEYQSAAAVRNIGDDICVIGSPRIGAGSSSLFSISGPVPSVQSLPPGGRAFLPIRFRADRLGRHEGVLEFDVSDPGAPLASISLEAEVIDGCLKLQPPTIDFGERRVSCPVLSRQVRLTNHCATKVTVQSAAFASGSHAPGELGYFGPAVPFEIAVGASRTFDLEYDPKDDGIDAAIFQMATTHHPVVVPVIGSGTLSDERTDVFRQRERKPVDILFVIDNSGSMTDKQLAVANGCDEFMQYALQQGIDFHIGVTTTGLSSSSSGWNHCPGGASGGERGRLFPVDRSRPRWVTSAMPNAAQIFAQNVNVGICHWLEQGLEAAYLALSSPLVDHDDDPTTTMPSDGNLGFYRPHARLSVVIISDEEDQSNRATSFYSSFFRGLKGPGREGDVSVNVVVGKSCGFIADEGLRYMEVANDTGGMIEPICTDDWGESLGRLAEQSFGYQLAFTLTGVPEGGVRVVVDGAQVTSGWTFDPTKNAVVFTEATAPAPGSTVEVTYVPSCGS